MASWMRPRRSSASSEGGFEPTCGVACEAEAKRFCFFFRRGGCELLGPRCLRRWRRQSLVEHGACVRRKLIERSSQARSQIGRAGRGHGLRGRNQMKGDSQMKPIKPRVTGCRRRSRGHPQHQQAAGGRKAAPRKSRRSRASWKTRGAPLGLSPLSGALPEAEASNSSEAA